MRFFFYTRWRNCPIEAQIYLKDKEGQIPSWRAPEGTKHIGGCLLPYRHLEKHIEPRFITEGPCMARRGHVPGEDDSVLLLLHLPSEHTRLSPMTAKGAGGGEQTHR